MTRFGVIIIGALAIAGAAYAGGEAKKYEVKVEPAKAKVGAKSKASFKIAVVDGSHVSDEAPLKVNLKSDGLKLEKEKLTTADIVDGKGASPKFEVLFTADKAGAQSITADATFIVCTKEMCEREVEKITIPVQVE